MLKKEELKPYSVVLKKKFDLAILHWNRLPYLVHSKYRREILYYEQKERAKPWLQKRNPLFITCAINFGLKENSFPDALFEDQVIQIIDANKWQRCIAKA